MSLPWFRLYYELKDDPKIGALSDTEFRVFIEAMCWACGAQKNGSTGLTMDTVDWAFRKPVKSHIESLITKNLLTLCSGEVCVTKWESRQKASDKSARRTQKYRERLRSVGSSGNYLQHKKAVFERDCAACVYCGSKTNLCLDHVVPLIRGGTNAIENLVCACKECNSGKAGRTPWEAGYKFANKAAEIMCVTVTQRKCDGHGDGIDKNRIDKNRIEENRNREEEKRRDTDKIKDCASGDHSIDDPLQLPEKLRTQRMQDKWIRWMNHRRGFRKPKNWLTLFTMQIEFLSQYDEATAHEILCVSLRNGYQGLFPPKNANTPTRTPNTCNQTPENRRNDGINYNREEWLRGVRARMEREEADLEAASARRAAKQAAQDALAAQMAENGLPLPEGPPNG